MPASLDQLEVVYTSVISLILAGAGLASMLMILVGGFQFLTAGADKEATQKAARTLTYAVIGLVVTLSAWVLMNFLGNFLGVNFSVFNICLPGFSSHGPAGGGCI